MSASNAALSCSCLQCRIPKQDLRHGFVELFMRLSFINNNNNNNNKNDDLYSAVTWRKAITRALTYAT